MVSEHKLEAIVGKRDARGHVKQREVSNFLELARGRQIHEAVTQGRSVLRDVTMLADEDIIAHENAFMPGGEIHGAELSLADAFTKHMKKPTQEGLEGVRESSDALSDLVSDVAQRNATKSIIGMHLTSPRVALMLEQRNIAWRAPNGLESTLPFSYLAYMTYRAESTMESLGEGILPLWQIIAGALCFNFQVRSEGSYRKAQVIAEKFMQWGDDARAQFRSVYMELIQDRFGDDIETPQIRKVFEKDPKLYWCLYFSSDPDRGIFGIVSKSFEGYDVLSDLDGSKSILQLLRKRAADSADLPRLVGKYANHFAAMEEQGIRLRGFEKLLEGTTEEDFDRLLDFAAAHHPNFASAYSYVSPYLTTPDVRKLVLRDFDKKIDGVAVGEIIEGLLIDRKHEVARVLMQQEGWIEDPNMGRLVSLAQSYNQGSIVAKDYFNYKRCGNDAKAEAALLLGEIGLGDQGLKMYRKRLSTARKEDVRGATQRNVLSLLPLKEDAKRGGTGGGKGDSPLDTVVREFGGEDQKALLERAYPVLDSLGYAARFTEASQHGWGVLGQFCRHLTRFGSGSATLGFLLKEQDLFQVYLQRLQNGDLSTEELVANDKGNGNTYGHLRALLNKDEKQRDAEPPSCEVTFTDQKKYGVHAIKGPYRRVVLYTTDTKRSQLSRVDGIHDGDENEQGLPIVIRDSDRNSSQSHAIRPDDLILWTIQHAGHSTQNGLKRDCEKVGIKFHRIRDYQIRGAVKYSGPKKAI